MLERATDQRDKATPTTMHQAKVGGKNNKEIGKNKNRSNNSDDSDDSDDSDNSTAINSHLDNDRSTANTTQPWRSNSLFPVSALWVVERQCHVGILLHETAIAQGALRAHPLLLLTNVIHRPFPILSFLLSCILSFFHSLVCYLSLFCSHQQPNVHNVQSYLQIQ